MYDLPGLADATDVLWAAIARALARSGVEGVPVALARDRDLPTLWTDPELLLAQACGLPFVTLLAGRVRYVATPVYDLPGCAGGDYRSWIVVRDQGGPAGLAGLAGCIAAINAPHSQSGANALAATTAPHAKGRPFFAQISVTGSHQASIDRVREGRADCAAIDCVTWGLLAATDRAAIEGLRIIAHGPAAPCLPFVTSLATDDVTLARLRSALRRAVSDPLAAAACGRLGLRGIIEDEAAYRRIAAMRGQSLAQGCSNLTAVLRNAG